MNRKGQSLVLFIMFIPVIVVLFALIFDSALIATEHVKLKNIGKDAVSYLVKDEADIETVRNIILENGKDIEIINLTNNEVHLMRHVDSYFGKVVGHDQYELEVDYIGFLDNGELIIEEKGN